MVLANKSPIFSAVIFVSFSFQAALTPEGMTAIQSGYGAYKDVKGAVGKIKSFGTEAGKTIAAAETGNVFGAAYGTYKTYKAGDEAYKATTKAYESGQKAYSDFQAAAATRQGQAASAALGRAASSWGRVAEKHAPSQGAVDFAMATGF
jgi:hypothetical protein